MSVGQSDQLVVKLPYTQESNHRPILGHTAFAAMLEFEYRTGLNPKLLAQSTIQVRRRTKAERQCKWVENQRKPNPVKYQRKQNERRRKLRAESSRRPNTEMDPDATSNAKSKSISITPGPLFETRPLPEDQRKSLCKTPSEVMVAVTALDVSVNHITTSYIYLSYNPRGCGAGRILVNGNHFQVPRSLLSLLQVTLLRCVRSRNIYAAALCQISELESGVHVSNLDRSRATVSYVENASGTVCWLGHYDIQPLQEALALLRQASPQLAQVQIIDLLSGQIRVGLECWDPPRVPGKRNIIEKMCETIVAIFNSLYWTSNKCIIDIVPSKKTLLCCGVHIIDLADCIRGAQALLIMPKMRQRLRESKGFFVATDVYNLGRDFQKKRTIRLDGLLRTARMCSFTDPRQLVWDMVPLCRPRESFPAPSPSIDVTASVHQVFLEAATFIVLDSQSLKMWHLEAPPFGQLDQQDLEDSAVKFWSDAHKAQIQLNTRIISVCKSTLMVPGLLLEDIADISPILRAENAGYVCSYLFEEIRHNFDEAFRTREWKRLATTLVLGRWTNAAGEIVSTGATDEIYKSFLDFLWEWRKNQPAEKWPHKLPLLSETSILDASASLFRANLEKNAFRRSYFYTFNGLSGMSAVEDRSAYTFYHSTEELADDHEESFLPFPIGAIVGDWVAVIVGGYTPYILRQREDKTFEFIGECYLHHVKERLQNLLYNEVLELVQIR
ncbi:hypothetical protein F5Y09DRAFT_339035 [Xylaria sp. FL1042]|nr:hypothetical protein F5Y09DRAFT_339035 [Xylaria sp. FL1042]